MLTHHRRNSGLQGALAAGLAAAVLAGAAPDLDRARAASLPALGGVVVEPDGDGARVHVALPAPVRYATSAGADRVVITLDGVAAAPASHRLNVGPVTGVGVRVLGARVAIEVTTRIAMEVTAASFDGPVLVVRLSPRTAAHAPAAPVSGAPSTPPGGGGAAPVGAGLALTLEAGAGRLLGVAGLVRVAVADPQVLEVVPVSAQELLVTARAEGRTTMYVWDRTGRVWTYAVEVVPAAGRLDALRRLISTVVPTATVTVTEVPGGSAAGIGGAAPSAAPVPPALDPDAPALAAPIGGSAVPLRDPAPPPAAPPAGPGPAPARGPEGPGGVVLTGSVETQIDREKIEAIARAFAPTVVDLLTVRRPLQLKLQVEVVELDRNALRNLGVTWGGGEPTPGAPPSLNGGVYNLQIITAPGAGTAGLDLLIAQLQALVQQGRARLLAEPNLMVMAGTSASLLLGGQVPIPVSGENGAVTIEYKDFGVILNARPDVQEDGRVFMRIAPEVSTLDFNNAVKVNGFTIPALSVRRVETVVSMRPSETLVLGGLLQHQDAQLIQKIPVLGDLPVIGPLFRSTQFQHQETDLVIFVTPTAVDATDAPAVQP